ncbi:hypothetical protein AVEN_105634-1 [Araneus ventricosus]|uniref:Uncharacterized protein n=1 Tax=Araneus ventricosus TaxID=182803 RepID=A0A4Y2CJS2_ARAVE|nr:hypothetical protein AVEN_105634-1 [Araneus ventricosus]
MQIHLNLLIKDKCTDESGSFNDALVLDNDMDAIFCESDYLLCSRSNSPGSGQEIFLKGWYLGSSISSRTCYNDLRSLGRTDYIVKPHLSMMVDVDSVGTLIKD